ncbi:MAG: hypothetical protein JSW71_21530 [Gemmatimonadota bacterium]|nr:MAG: hypothetical protein JSW71_21530 [Gemmatimonadota bacterium]
MTETRRWLEMQRTPLVRRIWGAGLVRTSGLVLATLGVGVLLGRLGAYRLLPPAVILGWLGAVVVATWGVVHGRRWLRKTRPGALARGVELELGLRRGSVLGVVEAGRGSGSAALYELADHRALKELTERGTEALACERARANRALGKGAATLAAGGLVFLLSGPTSSAGNQFWHPITTLARSLGPVVLTVDRLEVRRGDTVTASVAAVGRRSATLWTRQPGEPWNSSPMRLDSAGTARVRLGPLDSDFFVTAVSGKRGSDTVHVRVLRPAFLTDLQLLARFPRYVERPDELLVPGETALLPVGTRVLTSGRITLPLRSVEWRSGPDTVTLDIDDRSFSGVLRVSANRGWLLHVTTRDGIPLAEGPVRLDIIALPDSAPTVVVPVPGADAAVPLTLRQPLVIDARDDHGLTKVELVSWRTSRFGAVDEPVSEPIPLPKVDTDRAVLQWILDLNGRGFLPGDTARFKVRAADNAPQAQVSESREYVLWLPSVAELRDEMRDRARMAQQGGDSLLQAQEELAKSLEDLAAERQRSTETPASSSQQQGEELPFNSAERARELADQQQRAIERAMELSEELQQLADAAWSAGITDPEFHRQLRDIEELLDQALTDELRSRLEALRNALERLDAEAAREALRRLAESADQLRQELQRGRELFGRAALEGTLTSLADDAEELTRRQEQWNQTVEGGDADSAVAAHERELAAGADSLAAQLSELAATIEHSEQQAELLQDAAQSAGQAAGEMRRAASQAQRGERTTARQSGELAQQSLEPVAEQLRQQRDELRESWRQEVIAAMDRALVETARLAEQQQQILERLNSGESGAELRGAQVAARSGVERILEQIQGAAGKNALVSPQLGTALGFSKLRMSEALDQIQRANPNTRQAGALAGEALDGLNALAYALVRSRADVAAAQSGSGLSEALERLAQLAEQQGRLNNSTSDMLSMMPSADQQMLQQLQALALQQRSLAEQMDHLQAEADMGGIDELADEARELARELEAARLDRETVERQEQLFRRLLDAGRTLRSDEEDERDERVSETADPRNVQQPPAGQLPTVSDPRFPYPSWNQLRSLSPEDRRLVLDYFRRLNRGRP